MDAGHPDVVEPVHRQAQAAAHTAASSATGRSEVPAQQTRTGPGRLSGSSPRRPDDGPGDRVVDTARDVSGQPRYPSRVSRGSPGGVPTVDDASCNFYNLARRFAQTEDHLRLALADRAVVIDPREAQILVGRGAKGRDQTGRGGVRGRVSARDGGEESADRCVGHETCKGFLQQSLRSRRTRHARAGSAPVEV